jgi:hypothetical protein
VSIYRNCKAGKNYDITIIDESGTEFKGKEIVGDWAMAEAYQHGKF